MKDLYTAGQLILAIVSLRLTWEGVKNLNKTDERDVVLKEIRDHLRRLSR